MGVRALVMRGRTRSGGTCYRGLTEHEESIAAFDENHKRRSEMCQI